MYTFNRYKYCNNNYCNNTKNFTFCFRVFNSFFTNEINKTILTIYKINVIEKNFVILVEGDNDLLKE